MQKRLAALLALLALTVVAAITATFMLGGPGSTGRVPETATRLKLLSQKGSDRRETASTTLLSKRSVLYSSSVYDTEVDSSYTGKLPWASQVTPEPGGGYSFTWRIKLSTRADFSVKTDEPITGPFSIRLSDASGAPLYALTGGVAIPADKVQLTPGIYVIDASSDGPLDLFEVRFKTYGKPAAASAKTTQRQTSEDQTRPAPFRLKSIHVEMDTFAMRDFKRLVDVSRNSTDNDIVKMAGGRVRAKIVDEGGQRVADARIGLSGRTKGHLEWFPSLDLKLGGGSFMGIESFKLYRLDTKSGLMDLIFLSLYKDMGFMVPRQEVIKLFVNEDYIGLYILMETPGPAMFTTQRRAEANIIGIDTDKMFFDYPYGATLDAKYFYRLKGPGSKKRGRRFFLSSDFTSMIDQDSFAKFLAFASIYYATHGLGVDDLRFYENPVTKAFEPLPRDLNPNVWLSNVIVRSYLTHLAWLQGPPLYTIWPIKKPLKHDYSFDRSKDLFENAYQSQLATGTTDIHFSVSGFVADARNLELTNRYLRHFSENTAMTRKIATRATNTLIAILRQEPSNNLLSEQLQNLNKIGVPFFGEFLKTNRVETAPSLADSESTFFWNLRNSTSLDPELMPSLVSPVRHELDSTGWQNQLALAFLSEKKIFNILEEAGVKLPKRSFKSLPGVKNGAISLTPYAYAGTRNKAAHKPIDQVEMNVVGYLGTHLLPDDTALLLLLVRNATEDVRDYKVVMRDGLTSYLPVVNTPFRLHEGKGREPVTVRDLLYNHFSWGETLRLLAFKLPLGKKAEFYSVSMPEGSWFFFPPYMYLPARGSAAIKEPLATPLPDGIERVSDGYLIPDNARVEITGDLILPKGAALEVGSGAVITMRPASSITVNGDLIIKGTKKRRVKFKSADGRAWGGIYAGGSSSGNIKVELLNVDFADYGEFPKTRVGNKYLNGSITLYRANVRIDGMRITGAKGEDAINLINSTAFIRDTVITAPFSDAMDLDFSTASIEGLRVEGALGDGLDLSVSLVEISGSNFSNSGDKGISIGEMSTVYVKNSSFTGNAIAIANKDQSHLELSGTSFEGNGVALAEFIKKPYFARPTSATEKNRYSNNDEDYSWLGLRR